MADPELFREGSKGGGGLTIGQHPQPSSDYEEDYVIGIRRPEFRAAGAPLAPPGSAKLQSSVYYTAKSAWLYKGGSRRGII